MKKYITAILLSFAVLSVSNAQNRNTRSGSPAEGRGNAHSLNHMQEHLQDTTNLGKPSMYTWKIDPRFGERIMIPNDSVLENFHQSSLVEGKGLGVSYLGNIGSPAEFKYFLDKPQSSRFTFLNNYRFWRKDPTDQLFLNTKIPYSNIYYQKGGGGQSSEEHFKMDMSSNFGKKLNVGFNFDYMYARGFYQSLYNRQINYDFFASYMGDRYKMYAYAANNNFNNSENGGIKHPGYITRPDTISTFRGSSLDIPVRMKNTWNRMRGRHLYVTNRYDLGSDKEEYQVNDSTTAFRKKENYVPLSSVIFTTHYTDQKRRMRSYDSANLDTLYTTNLDGVIMRYPQYIGDMDDIMSYYSFKNTLALTMNEGFRSWTKFGLTAFVEYDLRKFSMPASLQSQGDWGSHNILPTTLPGMNQQYSERVLFIGGVLSKEKGKYLRYKAYAEKDLLNGDYRLEGQLTTMLKFKGKDFALKANAYLKDIMPSFFENHFNSKYWSWNNDFNDTRRFFVGGEILFPAFSFSKTKLSGGTENIWNYIYYGEDGRPAQESALVNVLSFRLDQQFKLGMLHWDSQVAYQTTSNDKVIPLPELTFYTNLYIITKIAKVLTLQLGADTHFFTKYYAPGYEPLTIQFYNQRDQEIGGFPIATAYANLHLKNTRFFIMMYNIADGMGNSSSFTVPNYPINPRMIKFGLSWKFNN